MDNSYELGFYMAIFLDVLGQGKKLEELRHLPTNQTEITKTAQILNETAGAIVRLREGFDSLFAALSKPTPIFDKLPYEKRSLAKSLRQIKITRRGISDSYIMTLQLAEDKLFGISGVMLNIWSALVATCGMFIAALAERLAIRGGVDIGLGTILPIDKKDEVYGPAVMRAVRLEGNAAQYPRVVVGEGLWQYLCEVESSKSNNQFDSFARNYAVNSKKLIYQDYDGIHTLDCFGEGIHSIENAINPQIVEMAYKWVAQEHKKYIMSKNFKLAGKYSLLRQYIESRLALWGVAKIQ
jgi:hypothetical protein